ncbi:hypothetical protein P8891_05705 [Bacillus atrophaeus]|uniref:hypothetical protein n=1 Tax=Bacillus atrophaeus TaxID=1452 RepID=UPI0022829DC9|nr:hypothetical protein [Bacillus atrophaeus]MCY7947949.1 hypothetical protein [Bacillus atrophaeus]MCY8098252.1 hypothetical protein [Bacillus atrophaeus]MCY9170029.1 hypothetical protein [Bacillus atrophaeus]MEC0740582.1 hypothetical protein [Bacillus atrophaeus]MEC0746982.1 hypothetical protein [Bacillus atrophaeus]
MERALLAIIEKNNLPVKLEPTNKSKKIMCFNRRDNVIKYNIENLRLLRQKHFLQLTLEEVGIICLCHEIGHFIENRRNPYIGNEAREFNKKDKSWLTFKFNREKNAYKFGYLVLPNHLKESYEKVNELNLANYRNKMFLLLIE